MMFNWLECSKGCAKGLLMGLNSLCIFVAISCFGLAVVDIRVLHQYGSDKASGTLAGDIIIIGASLLLVAVAVFGSVAVAKNNAKYLYLYVGFLMMIMILELMIAIYVSIQRYGLEFRVTDRLREDFFGNYTRDALDEHNKLWDNLQNTYECCGLNGPEDYPAVQQPISMSCCPRAYRARTDFAQKQLYKNCIDSKSYNTYGCEDEVLYALRESAECLLSVAVVSFWFEASGMLLAMYVANTIRYDKQKYLNTLKILVK